MDLTIATPQFAGGIMVAYGGLGDTQFRGSSFRNVLYDGENYSVFGGPTGDNDLLIGGALGDVLQTHGGDDRSYGGGGDDWIIDSPQANSTEDYGDTTWVNTPGHSNRDRLYGEAGNDVMVAGAGDGFLDGGVGNDELYAGVGDDTLIGGSGDDWLQGNTLFAYLGSQGMLATHGTTSLANQGNA
jgi:Ca2+-binding RTX toxin-like protein